MMNKRLNLSTVIMIIVINSNEKTRKFSNQLNRHEEANFIERKSKFFHSIKLFLSSNLSMNRKKRIPQSN